MVVEVIPILPQLIDPNMIVKATRKHFNIQMKPVNKPIYKKSYLEWVDKMMALLKVIRFQISPLSWEIIINLLWNMLVDLLSNVVKQVKMNTISYIYFPYLY